MSDSKKITNLYDVLGIDKSASTNEGESRVIICAMNMLVVLMNVALILYLVKKAYRKKVLETHPDKLDPAATDGERQAAEREFHKVHNLL